MKKRIVFISIGSILCVCTAVFIITKNNTVHQSDYAFAESGDGYVYDDNGMFYINSTDFLMYMDNTTGESIPVCARADCTHDSSTCDAFYDGMGHNLLLYDDMIYITYFGEETTVDSDGFEQSHNIAMIECANKDGSNKKEVYHKNTGAVTSMLAVNGRLYYTAYENKVEDWDSIDYFVANQFLYCYNMDWGTTKKLQEYKGDYEHYNSMLSLLGYTDKEQIYLVYQYSPEALTEARNYYAEIFTLNMQGNVLDHKMPDGNFNIADVEVHNDMIYVKYTEDYLSKNANNKVCRWKEDGTFELVLDLAGAFGSWMDNFYYVIYDENRKILLDFGEDKCYIAKAAVSDAHIVPDMYLLDTKNDVIYYDMTDYTGVPEGTGFSEDPRKLSCMKWSEFFETYFVEYDWQQLGDLLIGRGEGNED